MIKKLKRLTMALGCLTLLAAAPVHAQDLKLGALYPLSGGLALLGDESFRGTQMAIDERNAAGALTARRSSLSRPTRSMPTRRWGRPVA